MAEPPTRHKETAKPPQLQVRYYSHFVTICNHRANRSWLKQFQIADSARMAKDRLQRPRPYISSSSVLDAITAQRCGSLPGALAGDCLYNSSANLATR
jgi:hypothetical protein